MGVGVGSVGVGGPVGVGVGDPWVLGEGTRGHNMDSSMDALHVPYPGIRHRRLFEG